ncbi:hypothetical protein BJX76DRAFT_358828 [Aspergillus varians]
MGPDCTVEFVQHQIIKPKDKARLSTNGGGGGSVPSTPTANPRGEPEEALRQHESKHPFW